MLDCDLLQDDGKSIYVICFKHSTVAVISQLTTAVLKAGCARTSMNIIYQTDVAENNLGASFLFVFFKLIFLSDQFNPVHPAAKERSTRTLADNCLRLHLCGKIVCQSPSSGIAAGSKSGAVLGQKLTKRQAPLPRGSAPIPAPGR